MTTTWRGLRLALTLIPGILFGACGETSRPNVLIITVDTLRADHLGVYGAENDPTPNIDALARSSTLFENAAAPMPMTRPSHFSMLTSRYPRELGVLNNSAALPESALSVAEILREADYHTAAVVGVQLLSLKSGVSQGFGVYNRPRIQRDRPAELVVQRALKWLDNLPRREEFFLWVHLFDPHMPYEPPAEFRPAGAGELTAIDWELLEEIAATNGGDIPAAVLEQSKALYRGEIAYTDFWIGELLKGVGERFDLNQTLVILTADHGECFGDGVYFDHAHCLSESAMRIPLIVRYPEQFRARERIANQTSIVDITPTILAAVGLEAETELSGRPLQIASSFENRAVLLQHPFYTPRQIERYPGFSLPFATVAGEPVIDRTPDLELIGVTRGEWKYFRGPDSERLAHLARGAVERTDVEDEFPEIRQEMESQLRKLLALHPPRTAPPAEVDEDLRETLEALGYVN